MVQIFASFAFFAAKNDTLRARGVCNRIPRLGVSPPAHVHFSAHVLTVYYIIFSARHVAQLCISSHSHIRGSRGSATVLLYMFDSHSSSRSQQSRRAATIQLSFPIHLSARSTRQPSHPWSSRGSDPCDTVDVIRFMASMGSAPMYESPTAAILTRASQPTSVSTPFSPSIPVPMTFMRHYQIRIPSYRPPIFHPPRFRLPIHPISIFNSPPPPSSITQQLHFFPKSGTYVSPTIRDYYVTQCLLLANLINKLGGITYVLETITFSRLYNFHRSQACTSHGRSIYPAARAFTIS